jgi:hypothetical protein
MAPSSSRSAETIQLRARRERLGRDQGELRARKLAETASLDLEARDRIMREFDADRARLDAKLEAVRDAQRAALEARLAQRRERQARAREREIDDQLRRSAQEQEAA